MTLKTAVFLCAMAFTSAVSAESYKISDISYSITGKTQGSALDRNLDINKKKVYESKEDFDVFLSDLKNQLESERTFKSASVEAEFGEAGEDGVIPVTLSIHAEDSHSMFLLPYPKYKSDDGDFPSGGTLKLKFKDYNFLGLMNTLNVDFSYGIETEEDDTDHVVGVTFSYDYPFDVDPFKMEWQNDFDVDYTIGDSAPEFDLSTGLDIKLPFDVFALDLTLTQSMTRENDYEKYNDEIYFTEFEQFSIPITVGEIENWGKVTYTPFVNATEYWDDNGISIENSDLRGVTVNFGHMIGTSRIDWKGNFRSGASVSVEQSYIYNTYNKAFIPYYSGDLEIFLASKWAGLAMRFYTFQNVQTYNNSNIVGTKIGSELRGIRDDQKFDDDYFSDGEENSVYQASPYALKTPSALIFNFDFPIRVFTSHWQDWRKSFIAGFVMPVFHTSDDPLLLRPLKKLDKLEFELQVSPFIDVGLTYNRATKKLYSLRDGFYAGGLELLVYPERWRSVVGRISFGVDVGRKIFKNKLNLDNEWRRTSTSTWELTIGLGLHY